MKAQLFIISLILLSLAFAQENQTTNIPPYPVIGFTTPCYIGVDCKFDGSASYDKDGNIVSYKWYFGDGASADSASVSHIYQKAGAYTFTFTVVDDLQASSSATGTVNVIEKVDLYISDIIYSPSTPKVNDIVDVKATIGINGAVNTFSVMFVINDNVVGRRDIETQHFKGATGSVTASSSFQIFGTTNVLALITGSDPQEIDTTNNEKNIEIKLEEVSINQPPIATIKIPYTCVLNQPCSFDGSASYDSDGRIVSYEWNFGDGTTQKFDGSPGMIEHTYTSAGIYAVILYIYDDRGSGGKTYTKLKIGEAIQRQGMSVNVIDARTGNPIPNARLELYLYDKFLSAATTDANGIASFVDLQPGVYKLLAKHENYVKSVFHTDLRETITITLKMEPTTAERIYVKLDEKFTLGIGEIVELAEYGIWIKLISLGKEEIVLDISTPEKEGRMGALSTLRIGGFNDVFGIRFQFLGIDGEKAILATSKAFTEYCGDKICSGGETPYSCSIDCGPPEQYACPAIYYPVCASNGRTYGNECEAKQNKAEILYKGVCREAEPETISLVRCLADRGAVVYWSKLSTHSISQKELFGDAWKYIKSVHCPDQPEVCSEAKITGYPRWLIDGQQFPGYKTLNELAELSGCIVKEEDGFCEDFEIGLSNDVYYSYDTVMGKYYCEEGMLSKLEVFLITPTGQREHVSSIETPTQYGVIELPIQNLPHLFTTGGKYVLEFIGYSGTQVFSEKETFEYASEKKEYQPVETIYARLGEPFKLEQYQKADVGGYLDITLMNIQLTKCEVGEKCIGGFVEISIIVKRPIAPQIRTKTMPRGEPAEITKTSTGMITRIIKESEEKKIKISPTALISMTAPVYNVTKPIESVEAVPVFRLYTGESMAIAGMTVTLLGIDTESAKFVVERGEMRAPEQIPVPAIYEEKGEEITMNMVEGWNLFSMPGALYPTKETQERCRPEGWRIFEYMKETNSFRETKYPEPSKAYWLYIPKEKGCMGAKLKLTHSLPLDAIHELTPGWNFVPIVSDMMGKKITEFGCEIKSAYIYQAEARQWQKMMEREISKDLYGHGMVVKVSNACRLVGEMGFGPPPLPED